MHYNPDAYDAMDYENMFDDRDKDQNPADYESVRIQKEEILEKLDFLRDKVLSFFSGHPDEKKALRLNEMIQYWIDKIAYKMEQLNR